MPKLPRGVPKPYKTEDGVWVCRFYVGTAPNGRRLTRTASSADWQTCINKAKKLRDDIAAGNLEESAGVKVSDWMEEWLNDIAKPRLRPRVWETYKSTVKCNIVPHIGARKLKDLTPADVRAMHKAVAKAGKSSRTVEIAHNTLSKALSDAMNNYKTTGIKENVCDLVDKPKVTSKNRGALTAEQARKLLTVSAETNDPMVSRWATALFTGARQGEALALQWDRVDFENNLIDLSWQLQDLPKKHGCGDPTPKGNFPCGKNPTRPSTCPASTWDVEPGFEMIPLGSGRRCMVRPKTTKSIRIVPMVPPLAAALLQHRESAEPNPFSFVWVSEQIRPIASREDGEGWSDALAKADLPQVTIHAARHTTATLLLEAGVDPMIIAQILGHVSILTTQMYTHVDQTLARQALSKLDKLIQIA